MYSSNSLSPHDVVSARCGTSNSAIRKRPARISRNSGVTRSSSVLMDTVCGTSECTVGRLFNPTCGHRMLRGQTPGFLLTAVPTLALAIGASRAVFAVVDSVVLKPLRILAARVPLRVAIFESKVVTWREIVRDLSRVQDAWRVLRNTGPTPPRA